MVKISLSMNKYWFKAKEYGWGWYPSSWQGWFVLGAWGGVLVVIFRNIDATSHSVSGTLTGFFLPFVAATLVLIAICWKKGERPSWHWAGKPMAWHRVMMKIAFVVGIGFVVAGLLAFIVRNG